MQGKGKIEMLAETPEDRILLARIQERLESGRQRDCIAWTAFLSPREQQMTRSLMGSSIRFFGGYDGAERAVACYLPEYMEPAFLIEDGPVACIRASFYEKDTPGHRDFLGALLGLGLKREVVGDICMEDGSCLIFLLSELSSFVQQNLTRAGRASLRLDPVPLSCAAPPPPRVTPSRCTVASLRLDCVLSAGFHISRSQAALAIKGGHIFLNGIPCVKADHLAEEGDTVSLRGSGKLRVGAIGGITKKGRMIVTLEKYE